ncbi:MAG: hypothetical protein NTY37_11375 [Methanothrix sp.]|nr:hypothetical protein [Methanothrix sp.]
MVQRTVLMPNGAIIKQGNFECGLMRIIEAIRCNANSSKANHKQR